MSQISPPVRILLGVAIIFLAAWFTFLKPDSGTEVADVPAATQGTAPGADTASVSNPVSTPVSTPVATAATPAAVDPGAVATPPAQGTPAAEGEAPTGAATPAVATDGMPARLRHALDKGKVAVVLFHQAHGNADSIAVQRLREVYGQRGKVARIRVPASQLGRWERVTRDLTLSQLPAFVLVDRSGQATLLDGFEDAHALDEAVAAALLRTEPAIAPKGYLARLEQACTRSNARLVKISSYRSNPAEARAQLRKLRASGSRLVADLRALHPDKGMAKTHAALRSAARRQLAATEALTAGASAAKIESALRRPGVHVATPTSDLHLQLAAHGVTACG